MSAMHESVKKAYQSVKKATPDFKERDSQVLMMSAIANTLQNVCANQNPAIVVIEGPTGVGKSLGYGLPSIAAALSLGKHLVISTATVALQNQLARSDLPRLAEHSGLNFSFRVAKGRSRFVCREKVAQLSDGMMCGSVLDHAWLPHIPLESIVEDQVQSCAAAFAGGWNGDVDIRAETLDGVTAKAIGADSLSCAGTECRYYDSCGVFAGASSRSPSEVIVANHDLVLADLAMGGGKLLPPPEDTIYVFDEAHHLEDKTRAHLSRSIALSEIARSVRRLARQLVLIRQKNPSDDTADAIKALGNTMRKVLGELHACSNYCENGVGHYRPNGSSGGQYRRFVGGALTPELQQHFCCLIMNLEKIVAGGEQLIALANSDTPKEVLRNVTGAQTKVRHFTETLIQLIDGTATLGRACWIEKLINKNSTEIRISWALLNVGEFLSASLWKRCAGAVLTSATITAGGSFDACREVLGLGSLAADAFIKLPAVFDYQTNGRLSLPAMRNSPADVSAYSAEVAKLIPDLLVPSGGSLILCSSRKLMTEIVNGLPPDWIEAVLVQGSMPLAKLLALHTQAIEQRGFSVLVGLASLAEGVDLPGNLLNHVIIPKLPFDAPGSPLYEALTEWMTAQGKDPFLDMAIPNTARKLMQWVGRLLRTETDTGTVTILDQRLTSKEFGRILMDTLPPFTRVVSSAN